jgi:hypothetical protein
MGIVIAPCDMTMEGMANKNDERITTMSGETRGKVRYGEGNEREDPRVQIA